MLFKGEICVVGFKVEHFALAMWCPSLYISEAWSLVITVSQTETCSVLDYHNTVFRMYWLLYCYVSVLLCDGTAAHIYCVIVLRHTFIVW